jgi:WD40 repeat protein
VYTDSGLTASAGAGSDDDEEEEEEEEQVYDDASVLRYVMPAAGDEDFEQGEDASAGRKGELRLAVEGEPLSCLNLTAIYSMHFHPSDPTLLLAGGKAGYVSLFKLPDRGRGQAQGEVALSFLAHKSWVCSTKFLSPSLSASLSPSTSPSLASSSLLVLTSSNDGSVKLWDLAKLWLLLLVSVNGFFVAWFGALAFLRLDSQRGFVHEDAERRDSDSDDDMLRTGL